MNLRGVLVLGLAIVAILLASPAFAHKNAMSGTRAVVSTERVEMGFDFDAPTVADVLVEQLDVDQDGRVIRDEIAANQSLVFDYLLQKIVLRSDAGSCTPVGDGKLDMSKDAKWLRVWLDFECPAGKGLTLENRAFLEDRGGHRHLTQVRIGGEVHEKLLKNGDETWTLDASGAKARTPDDAAWMRGSASPKSKSADAQKPKPAPKPKRHGSVFTSFLIEGVWHILIGLDHVLFVIVLVLVALTLKELALVVTSFTLAHSITLALGSLEVVNLPSRFVESMIALSIVYVAVENIVREAPRARAGITFAFGLLHGFGFSTVLGEVGLPSDRLVSALLAFNLGVELGQLAIVLPVFPLLAALRRYTERSEQDPDAPAPWLTYPQLRRTLSGLVAALATIWLIERVFDIELVPI